LLIAAFAILSSMTVVVESGNVGVVTTLGAVQPNALPEGFHLKKPMVDQVHQMDVRVIAVISRCGVRRFHFATAHYSRSRFAQR
jgi:regulator of protease activity HflC (stomatin/prohibitin superfamily)